MRCTSGATVPLHGLLAALLVDAVPAHLEKLVIAGHICTTASGFDALDREGIRGRPRTGVYECVSGK